MEQKQKTIEEKIMGEIHSGKIKLRSKYVFLAEKLGLGSAVVFSILLCALAFHILLFYLQATDNLIYLSFGKIGILAFLESFPYLLVIGFICLVFLAAILVKKSNLSYKRPFIYSMMLLLGLIVVGGSALTYTGVADKLEDEGCNKAQGRNFLRVFFADCAHSRRYGVAGRIFDFESQAILLQTPNGLRRVMVLSDPSLNLLRRGQFVVVVGQMRDEIFWSEQIRIIDEGRIPSIRRGVNHRFPVFENQR